MEDHKRSPLNTPSAIVLAGVIIALAIVITRSGSVPSLQGGTPPPGGNAPTPSRDIVVEKPSSQDHWFGARDAKIVVIEFSDLECPFCKMFHPTIKGVVDSSKGEVALVFRHFPLDQLHPKARKEAEASECAAELGGNEGFWKYVDRLFEVTPANNGLDAAELPKIAAYVGLDTTKFNACLSSGKYAAKVEEHVQDGIKAGATGTPTSVVMNVKTGKKVLLIGAESAANVQNAIASVR